jgi:hypothetical protein
MTPSALKKWLETDDSKAVGITPKGETESVGHYSGGASSRSRPSTGPNWTTTMVVVSIEPVNTSSANRRNAKSDSSAGKGNGLRDDDLAAIIAPLASLVEFDRCARDPQRLGGLCLGKV